MPKTYDFTVRQFRDLLDKACEEGDGDKTVVVSVAGSFVTPIESIGGCGIDLTTGRATEDSEDFVLITGADMLPVSFWKQELAG